MTDGGEVWAPDPADVIPDGVDVPATVDPSGETFYPASLQARKWWVNWVRAYRWDQVDDPDAVATKQPTAPYRNGTAKPVKWNSGLPEKKHPSTDFETVEPWGGTRIGVDIHAPDRVVSDQVGIGIIIPTDQDDRQTITLIDWDDVRNPETNEIHPVCAWALRELDGYAEISQSGEGVHQLVYGEIPGWSKKYIRHIDTEPFVGDDLPQVEIYQSGRVTAMTGRHVAGTGRDIAEGQDLIDELVLAYIDATNNGPNAPSRPINDGKGGALEGDADAQTTHERAAQAIRDSVEYDGDDPSEWDLPEGRSVEYHAVLKARERADELVTTANWELLGYAGVFGHFDGLEEEEILADLRECPTPRHGYRPRKAQKEVSGAIRKAKNGNLQTPSRNTLVRRGILPESWATEPTAITGERKPVAAVLFARFDNAHEASQDDAEGEDHPTTGEARDRLKDRIYTAFRASQTVLIDAPTSLGKSYTVATEPWLYRTDITGDAPVVQLAPTREARDANLEASKEAGVNAGILKGRAELCPVCRGDHDPEPDGEDPETVLTVNGVPISEWFKHQCDNKGLTFQFVHSYAAENNDQFIDLPCSEGETDCPAHTQWDGVPWADEGGPSHDVIHATHPFAYVPGLRNHCNVVIDETPDFAADLSNAQVRKAVTAFLRTVNAPVNTYESFIQLAHFSGGGGDAAAEQDELEQAIEQEPDREWFVKHPDAHGLAPALARAIYNAVQYDELDSNNRRSSTVHHEPPRYDEDGDSFGGNWLTVVLDNENTVRTVRHTPNFATARSVVGLDAHPAPHVWQRNIGPMLDSDLSISRVLTPTERRLWRRYERGLTVVQVGDATRPLSGDNAREWFDADSKLDVLLQALCEHAGGDFRTAITTAQAEKPLADRMEDAGVVDPKTMHYGEEKSRNDFGDERIGFVNGCMDPGDDYVLDMLTESGLDATVPRADPEDYDDPETAYCDHCEGDGCNRCNQTGRTRERGREFIGPDADVAAELLASVRENHVAQAAGRYARSPDDPENTATVYVRTDATPEGLVDFTVAGVEWVATDLQREVVRELSQNDAMTAKQLGEAAGCSKRHAKKDGCAPRGAGPRLAQRGDGRLQRRRVQHRRQRRRDRRRRVGREPRRPVRSAHRHDRGRRCYE